MLPPQAVAEQGAGHGDAAFSMRERETHRVPAGVKECDCLFSHKTVSVCTAANDRGKCASLFVNICLR